MIVDFYDLLGFGLLVGQNKASEDVKFGRIEEHFSLFSNNNQSINQENIMKIIVRCSPSPDL